MTFIFLGFSTSRSRGNTLLFGLVWFFNHSIAQSSRCLLTATQDRRRQTPSHWRQQKCTGSEAKDANNILLVPSFLSHVNSACNLINCVVKDFPGCHTQEEENIENVETHFMPSNLWMTEERLSLCLAGCRLIIPMKAQLADFKQGGHRCPCRTLEFPYCQPQTQSLQDALP